MEVTLTIPDEVAAEIQFGSGVSLPRRVLELAAIKTYEADLITECKVMETLGFEDREELFEFFKRYDVRSKHTAEDFERSYAALDELLSRKMDDNSL